LGLSSTTSDRSDSSEGSLRFWGEESEGDGEAPLVPFAFSEVTLSKQASIRRWISFCTGVLGWVDVE
jgi:hypothetical protein